MPHRITSSEKKAIMVVDNIEKKNRELSDLATVINDQEYTNLLASLVKATSALSKYLQLKPLDR